MKAVLVIDKMPMDCDHCQFGEEDCVALKKEVDEYIWETTEIIDGRHRPSWCPLKPLPKEEDIYEVGMDEEDTNAKRQWNKGWNACLKEIEK